MAIATLPAEFCFGFSSARAELMGANLTEAMAGKAGFEEIAVDRLCGDSALARGNNHLTIGWGDATGSIKTGNTGTHVCINTDLAFRIDGSTEAAGEFVEVDVSASSEKGADFNVHAVAENKTADL